MTNKESEKMVKQNGLVVSKIKNGTVIDRIPAGYSFLVMKLLNIDENFSYTVSMVTRVKSQKLGIKDVLKISEFHLDERGIRRLGLFIAGATVNKITDYEVVEKTIIPPPSEVHGILRCANPNCVTNYHEPIETKFKVTQSNPMTLRCMHCNWSIHGKERIQELLQ